MQQGYIILCSLDKFRQSWVAYFLIISGCLEYAKACVLQVSQMAPEFPWIAHIVFFLRFFSAGTYVPSPLDPTKKPQDYRTKPQHSRVCQSLLNQYRKSKHNGNCYDLVTQSSFYRGIFCEPAHHTSATCSPPICSPQALGRWQTYTTILGCRKAPEMLPG